MWSSKIKINKKSELAKSKLIKKRWSSKIKTYFCALLGCYAEMICSSVPTFRDKLSLTFSWVKQFKKNVFFWGCSNLEGEADRLFRNVCNYQLMLRYIPEEEKILFALTRKSEIKHNVNFGKAGFVPAVVTQNFGNIDVAFRYPRSWSVRAWLFPECRDQ